MDKEKRQEQKKEKSEAKPQKKAITISEEEYNQIPSPFSFS